ncbi:MAG TPA: 50S ribosomal protein L23 [Candidatus Saccharimonadales bacterium]|nr:50S ribosomal protein L23 [Candidatus Saccharimonadales bacterium]
MSKSAALKPKISEKSYGLAETANTYVFAVDKTVNKHDLARSVAAQYEVTVMRVRIAGTAGKTRRSVRGRGRNIFRGQTSPVRKAYVTLKEGDKLPIFSAVEEPAKPDKDKK